MQSNYDLQVDMVKKLFLEYDQDLLINKFELKSDDDFIYIDYLNVPCRIGRKDGSIQEYTDESWRECRTYGTVMTIYDLLCHHKGKFPPALYGIWCGIGSFVVTGVKETDAFTKKYAELFDGRTEELKTACVSLGGVLEKPVAGSDITCRIPVTKFFPVLFQFWEGDEEFPPKLMMMWDKNAMSFLHFETTFFLQGDILERLKEKMK